MPGNRRIVPFSVYLFLFSGPDFHQLSKYVATATRTCTINAVLSSLSLVFVIH